MRNTWIYLNGEIVPADQAAISPLDIGLLRGYAVFDLLRTVNGRPFLLDEHLARLRHSAARLGLSVPADDREIADAVDELLARDGRPESIVRFVLTGGVSDGMRFDPERPTFFILTHELHEPPASLYEEGGRLVTREHVREVPDVKTTNYLTMIRHQRLDPDTGDLDLLYHDGTRVLEAASASVYFVTGGRILAPATDVLHGTIGTFVLDLARAAHPVEVREVTLAEALGADEAFLTSTTRGVVPITGIDDRIVGDGSVGPIVRDLMERYREAVFGAR